MVVQIQINHSSLPKCLGGGMLAKNVWGGGMLAKNVWGGGMLAKNVRGGGILAKNVWEVVCWPKMFDRWDVGEKR